MKEQKGIVNVPVADLRSEPKAALYSYEKDPLQESQLLFGDPVLISQESGDWMYVEAPEQLRFRLSTGWTGYPGWIKKSQIIEISNWPQNNLIVKVPWAQLMQGSQALHVSLGTKLKSLRQFGENWIVALSDNREAMISASATSLLPSSESLDGVRQSILNLATQCLGYPYLWGGRSAYHPEWNQVLTSVDCSGFVSLLYRVHGMQLPRDAQDQFLAAQPCEFNQLKPADLIFLAPLNKPHCMVHVMLYSGGDAFFDANIADRGVVQSTGQQRFGIPFHKIAWGQPIGNYHIFFGQAK